MPQLCELLLSAASLVAAGPLLPEKLSSETAEPRYDSDPLKWTEVGDWCRPTLQQCMAGSDKVWVFETEHKTGTALTGTFMTQVMKAGGPKWVDIQSDGMHYGGCGGPCGKPIAPSCSTPHALQGKCLSKVHAESGHMKINVGWPSLTINFAESMASIKRYEKSTGQKVRVAYWVREPLERIVSAYFYHKGKNNKCIEVWCNRVGDAYMQTIEEVCNGALMTRDLAIHNQHDVRPDEIACNNAVVQNKAHKLSYAQLLNKVPFSTGLMLEAWRSLDVTQGMLYAQKYIKGTEKVEAYSLTDAMAGKSKCLQKVAKPQFAHLGLFNKTLAERCAEMFCMIVAVGSQGHHSTHSTSEKLTKRALYYLRGNKWVHQHILKLAESLGLADAASRAGDHAFAATEPLTDDEPAPADDETPELDDPLG